MRLSPEPASPFMITTITTTTGTVHKFGIALRPAQVKSVDVSLTRVLNDRQKIVLAWIVDGCPEHDWPDESHKHTARALQSRRLARVSRTGGKWNATATEAGLFYAEHSTYPPGHWSNESDAPARPGALSTPRRPPKKAIPHLPSPTGRAAARALINRLQASNDSLDLKPDEVAKHRKIAQTARSTPGLLPEDKTVEVVQERYQWKVILIDHPEPAPAPDPTKVPVPEQLRRPHPAVARIRDNKYAMNFTRDTRGRALRCLDALVKAAVRSGYDVDGDEHDVTIEVRGHKYHLQFTEPSTRSDHAPTAEEIKRKERTGYAYAPRYDYTPTGRLNLKIGYWALSEPKPRKDGSVAWTLEERLGEALDHLEHSTLAAEERERQRREEEEARRRQYEIDRENAVAAWGEHVRANTLLTRARSWRDHRLMAEYIEALAQAVQAGSDEDRANSEKWLAWATKYFEKHPALARIDMPTVPTPAPKDLEPFMPRRESSYFWRY